MGETSKGTWIRGWFNFLAKRQPLTHNSLQTDEHFVRAKALATEVSQLRGELQRLQRVEAEITEAKIAAEAAAVAKGQFLATMSHEIRTPLNGILPVLELALDRPMEATLKESLSAAYESARDMRRIVNDVLDFSKLDASSIELETVSLAITDLSRSVVSLMTRLAESKGLRIDVKLGPNLPGIVRGDPLRVRQILANLLSNAVKFTQKGEVILEVEEEANDRAHRWIRFSVLDTGPGIPPEAANRLFKPFSQADASMARLHGGTGLGLAIVAKLVQAMGGRVGVESTLGKGSKFWVVLPLLRQIGELGAASEASVILLSRDESMRQLWQQVASDLDVRFLALGTAFETTSLLRTTLASRGPGALPDAILIDMVTSGRTAPSVARDLLTESQFDEIKVLLLGGGKDVQDLFHSKDRCAVAPRLMPRIVAKQHLGAVLGQIAALPASQEPTVSLRTSSRSFAGLRVLLVDDIPINLYAGKMVLQKLGCEVTLATGGREAIEIAATRVHDIILMDCQMPDVDGFSATRVIRINEANRNLARCPIIAVTANAMPGDREKCLESGMDDHVAKPMSLAGMSRALERWTKDQDAVIDECASA